VPVAYRSFGPSSGRTPTARSRSSGRPCTEHLCAPWVDRVTQCPCVDGIPFRACISPRVAHQFTGELLALPWLRCVFSRSLWDPAAAVIIAESCFAMRKVRVPQSSTIATLLEPRRVRCGRPGRHRHSFRPRVHRTAFWRTQWPRVRTARRLNMLCKGRAVAALGSQFRARTASNRFPRYSVCATADRS
jgi:hypothetical protein